MSRIDDLIAEYCPDGVEFKMLGEVCSSLNKGTLKTGELAEDGKYPVINSGREWYGAICGIQQRWQCNNLEFGSSAESVGEIQH